MLHRETSPPSSAEDTQTISQTPSVASSSTTCSSHSSSSGTSITKKRKAKAEEIDELFVKSFTSLKHNKIAKTEETDEDIYFGQQIAATLCRFTPRQKAIAKLRMQQILVDTEFTEAIPFNSFNI